MSDKEIKGSGTEYYSNMDADAYRNKINTPAKSPEYYKKFHSPIIDRAKSRFGSPIRVLDIACGPADELEFMKGDPDVQLVATDISESVLSSSKGIKNRLAESGRNVNTKDPKKDTLVFAADVNSPAVAENSVEAGVLVNAVVYAPDKMLKAMQKALKPGAECSVNFRDFSNAHNKVFYDYYLQRGGKLLDKELEVETSEGTKIFNVKVLDYTECVNDDGSPDKQIRGLVQQIYFQSLDDIKELIHLTGFDQVSHSQFEFSSPVNPNNQIDVFILQKPENARVSN